MGEVSQAVMIVFVFFRLLPFEAEVTVFARPAGDGLELGGHLVEGFDEVVLAVEENVNVENVCVVERLALIRRQLELLDDDFASIGDARCLETAGLAVGRAERDRNGTQF